MHHVRGCDRVGTYIATFLLHSTTAGSDCEWQVTSCAAFDVPVCQYWHVSLPGQPAELGMAVKGAERAKSAQGPYLEYRNDAVASAT